MKTNTLSLPSQQRLLKQLDVLDFLLEGVKEEDLQKRSQANKWSIFEILAHLGRYQEVFRDRYTAILRAGQVSFGRYRSDEDPDFTAWREKYLADLLTNMKKDRKQIAEEILSLDSDNLAKTGTHPMLGTMDIRKWVEFFLLHEAHHLYQVFQLSQVFST